jgi:hypothetical protein
VEPGTFYQGLWSFADFPAYLNSWLIPNVLKDLETVFEGACKKWKEDGEPENGRGDFVLAISLFALFDHLGAFLAPDENASLQTRENIVRMAHLLPTTRDVDLIVAHFGRNALVHGAWPQTAVLMDGGSWAFGLNISADPDESNHGRRYKRRYSLPCKVRPAPQLDILRLRLNIRVLRRELQECFLLNGALGNVKQEVFERLQDLAIHSCDLDFSKSFSG